MDFPVITQHFPIMWKSSPKTLRLKAALVGISQGSGFGCIAAKSSKCLLQRHWQQLVKRSHGLCKKTRSTQEVPLLSTGFCPSFLGGEQIKKLTNYRPKTMCSTLSWREWLLQERPNMGPMQVSSFPMAVAFGEINAQKPRTWFHV